MLLSSRECFEPSTSITENCVASEPVPAVVGIPIILVFLITLTDFSKHSFALKPLSIAYL